MMIASMSFTAAAFALNAYLPTDLYLRNANLPTRSQIHELLIVESDGEYWFSPESAKKQCKLDGLTEHQENIKLYCGFTHCPKCKNDLTVRIPASTVSDPRYGYFDYDIDTARIQSQFACRKCRHQWGTRASGLRDDAITPSHASPRAPRSHTRPLDGENLGRSPAVGSVTGQVWALADVALASMAPKTLQEADWKTLRALIVTAGEAAGIHPATVATQASKWKRANG